MSPMVRTARDPDGLRESYDFPRHGDLELADLMVDVGPGPPAEAEDAQADG